MTQIIGYNGSTNNGTTELLSFNRSRLIIGPGGSSTTILDANQLLDYVYVMVSSTNASNTATVRVPFYDMSASATDPIGAPLLFTKTIVLPNSSVQQWVQFGPFSDNLSSFAGKRLAVGLGIASSTYNIRQVIDTAGDGSNSDLSDDCPAIWTAAATSTVRFCVYATTRIKNGVVGVARQVRSHAARRYPTRV